MLFYFQIAFLLIVEGALIIKRSFLVAHLKIVYGILILASVIYSSYLTYAQYIFWANSPLAKYLLPPNRNILYFIEFSIWKFWISIAIALIFSLIFVAIAKAINNKFGGRFFEKEEMFLGGLALFASGYPGMIVYIFLILALFLVLSVIMTLIKGGSYRTSLYPLWIPTAIIAIISVEEWISRFPWWNIFKI